ncbi:MAG: DUF3499 family protein [Acidimicrobiales bacterium]|nr:DUF3499 family protein [Acidimicrobiales bacterium]
MGLICSRIGCREKAAASLQFDAERSTAVLIDLTHARNGMPLCERHASSRTAPVGWQMIDRRTGAKKLEMWSAEDEGKPAPDFAAPTDRPATRRPTDVPKRRADDSEEVTATAGPASEASAAIVGAKRPATKRPVDVPAPAAPEREEQKEEVANEFRWPKQSDEPEDPKDDLGADSPLLSRAFRAAK